MIRGELMKPFILVKGKDKYFYRAVDSDGNTRLLYAPGLFDSSKSEQVTLPMLTSVLTQLLKQVGWVAVIGAGQLRWSPR